MDNFTLYRRDGATTRAVVIASGRFDLNARSYVDASVQPGKTYHYELMIHARDGDEVRSATASATVPPLSTALEQNAPNPFQLTTSISYTLAERSPAAVNIYDATGALIIRVDKGVQTAGKHSIEWDGRDKNGRQVGSGVYFYQLEGLRGIAAKKLLLVK